MNCQNFESVVSDLAREQITEVSLRDSALAHSSKCRACSLRLEEQRALTIALRGLASEMSSAHASERIEEQLLFAFRSQVGAGLGVSLARRWYYWATAAAATLFVVFGIAQMRSRELRGLEQPAIETSRAQLVTDPPAPEKGSMSVNKAEAETLSVRSGRRMVRSHRGSSHASLSNKRDRNAPSPFAVNRELQTEIATDFMPIGYMSSISLQEGGQVVRVELPRSTLAAFGLPVNMDRYNEKLKADVVLGVDGVARAIRFVQ